MSFYLSISYTYKIGKGRRFIFIGLQDMISYIDFEMNPFVTLCTVLYEYTM